MKKSFLCSFLLLSFVFGQANETIKLDRDESIEILNKAVSKLIIENNELKKQLFEIKNGGKITKGDEIVEIKKEQNYTNSILPKYIVSDSFADVYESLDSKAKILKRYEQGELIDASEIDSNWLYVKKVGYVKKRQTQNLSETNISKILLTQERNIRSKPIISKGNIVGNAKINTEIEVYEYPINKFWYLMKSGNFIYKPRN